TRLALQLAAEMMTEHCDGVWHVDLSPIQDSNLVATAVARSVGLPNQLARDPLDVVTDHFGGGFVLLVLDNCEHLIYACAQLTETLLRACPSLAVVATSREPLGIAGETTWRVPSLGVPDEGSVTQNEALELFEDRARRVRPSFRLTSENATAV